ncbi:hypothetical protein [Bifidobacterium sp. SO4]|uniref:hypothetical protein n=1 Tax=Bifidobacterium sp. SO4 TaxID=2809030 RepID=UPI001BDC3546|nr:hypothetical protein [Bifidobacterium sp. SO4]MBT1170424.1 hypothetical protein [Bifidobacterium sp. SO4]
MGDIQGASRATHHGVRRTFALVAAVFMCAALAACGQGANANHASGTDANSGGQPAFSGPYADDFKQAYKDAPTDLIRDILKDGKITDAEVQEAYDAYNTCLEPYGLQAVYTPGEGESTGQYRGSLSNDEQLKVMQECQSKTGADLVSTLYADISSNPNNVDTAAMQRATYQCLAKHDLLPQPISESEYLAMVDRGTTQDSMTASLKRESEFFSEYWEQAYDGQPNPDFKYDQNTPQGHQFYLCNNDPLNQ